MSPSKDDPPSAPKIAIKGFSLSAKSKPSSSSNKPGAKPTPPSSLGKRPRSTFAHDSDSDSEGERKHGKHEVVTGFGEEGAVTKEERKGKGPLVIPRLGNTRHFGGDRHGKRSLLPPEVQAQMAAEAREREEGGKEKVEGVDVVNGGEEKVWGLSVRKKEVVENAEGESTVVEGVKETEVVEQKPKSVDDEALQALLGNGGKKGPDLIIPQHESEEASYRHAIATAPDASTLEDYERVPVEEFGAALLRGMGWDGKQDKSKVKEVKRRQNLLGLGAKELQGAEELGAWVQKTDTNKLRPAGSDGRRDRRPKVSEYKREKERRDERREERGGGSYRRERERDERRGGERDGYRDRRR